MSSDGVLCAVFWVSGRMVSVCGGVRCDYGSGVLEMISTQ